MRCISLLLLNILGPRKKMKGHNLGRVGPTFGPLGTLFPGVFPATQSPGGSDLFPYSNGGRVWCNLVVGGGFSQPFFLAGKNPAFIWLEKFALGACQAPGSQWVIMIKWHSGASRYTALSKQSVHFDEGPLILTFMIHCHRVYLGRTQKCNTPWNMGSRNISFNSRIGCLRLI